MNSHHTDQPNIAHLKFHFGRRHLQEDAKKKIRFISLRKKIILLLLPLLLLPAFVLASPALNLNVTYQVTPIKQFLEKSCWAVSTNMLYNWKYNLNIQVRDMVKLAGAKYLAIFDNNDTGIYPEDEINFYKYFGLEVIYGQNPSIEGWASYLKKYGPLSITVKNTLGIHAIVMTGIVGDGSDSGTNVMYIDPSNGISDTFTFKDFLVLYENKDSVAWPVQIIHWPEKQESTIQLSPPTDLHTVP